MQGGLRMLDRDIEKVVVSKDEIEDILLRLSKELTEDYAGKTPIMVGLLKGCIPFMSDLMKKLDFHLEVGYMDVSSYYGGLSGDVDVKIETDLNMSVKDRHVLIAEDIVDSGRTLTAVIRLLKHRGAKDVKVVTLLDKPEGRKVDLKPEYIGVTIPKVFVVGYGLDYDGRYRNLPYVGLLKPEIYS